MPLNAVVLATERLYGESLESWLRNFSQCYEVFVATDVKSAIAAVREKEAGFMVADLRGYSKSDVGFLAGAQRYANFPIFAVAGGEIKEDAESFTVIEDPHPENLLRALEGLDLKRPSSKGVRSKNSMGLSVREMQVASLVAKGKNNREISIAVGLKEQSIKNLVSFIMKKIKAENRTQLALFMRRNAG